MKVYLSSSLLRPFYWSPTLRGTKQVLERIFCRRPYLQRAVFYCTHFAFSKSVVYQACGLLQRTLRITGVRGGITERYAYSVNGNHSCLCYFLSQYLSTKSELHSPHHSRLSAIFRFTLLSMLSLYEIKICFFILF